MNRIGNCGKGHTYMTMMVIAKSALDCLQYLMFSGFEATLQLFAMYHGAPF